jgi:hypothetical protein
MKIEVGKTYKDNQGAEIRITHKRENNSYPFLGVNADGVVDAFTDDGEFFGPGRESDLDLVEEVPTASAPTPPAPVAPSLWDTLRATWAAGSTLPKDSAQRKLFPVDSGHNAYFPAAIVAVAGWSRAANEKHNPGQPLQHARGKSPDHRDCQARHAIDSADPSCDRLEELTCKAWRAYAELQEYAESLGAPPAPAATFHNKETTK